MTGKRLVQGCYAVTWVGVEPTTCESQGRTHTIEPGRPKKPTISLSQDCAQIACERLRVLATQRFAKSHQLVGVLVLMSTIVTLMFTTGPPGTSYPIMLQRIDGPEIPLSSSIDNAGPQQPKPTLHRTYFPETWLWQLVNTGYLITD